MRIITIAPYRYELEYNEFGCNFTLNVYRGDCRIIENMGLCLGATEIIDNVTITVNGGDIDSVTVQRINQVITELPDKKRLLFG